MKVIVTLKILLWDNMGLLKTGEQELNKQKHSNHLN